MTRPVVIDVRNEGDDRHVIENYYIGSVRHAFSGRVLFETPPCGFKDAAQEEACIWARRAGYEVYKQS